VSRPPKPPVGATNTTPFEIENVVFRGFRDADKNAIRLFIRMTRARREVYAVQLFGVFVAKSNEILHESIIRSIPLLNDDSAGDRVV
jgi:hypothetical protein